MSMQTRRTLDAYLLDEILSGRLIAGTRLPPERVLALQFGLSRPIVREVLRSLAERGFLDIQPSRGTFVREPQTTDGSRALDASYRRRNATIRELVEARTMLETQAASLAAIHATDEEIALMQACLEEFAATRHLMDLARLDIRFHSLVVQSGHNLVIESMYASIVDLTFELMLHSMSERQRAHRSGPLLHEAVLRAIIEHDAERAAHAMQTHFDVSRRYFGEDYDRSVNDVMPRTHEVEPTA